MYGVKIINIQCFYEKTDFKIVSITVVNSL